MDGLLNSQNSLSCRDRPQNAINRRQEIDRQSVSQSGTMRPKKSNVKCITFFRYKRWCKLDQKMGCPWRQDRRRRLICSGVDQRKTQGYGMPKMSKEWVWGENDPGMIFCPTLWAIVWATDLVSISNTACSHLCGLFGENRSDTDELLKRIPMMGLPKISNFSIIKKYPKIDMDILWKSQSLFKVVHSNKNSKTIALKWTVNCVRSHKSLKNNLNLTIHNQ